MYLTIFNVLDYLPDNIEAYSIYLYFLQVYDNLLKIMLVLLTWVFEALMTKALMYHLYQQ
jgi:hypothetical protein